MEEKIRSREVKDDILVETIKTDNGTLRKYYDLKEYIYNKYLQNFIDDFDNDSK